ncbi:MAG: discoidin domain-containing protein, partial [Luteolibacter sp.]
RILLLPETTTDRVRVRITQSRLEPSLASLGLHQGATLLDPPTISNRDAQGRVAIADANGNAIHYTTDNSTPTENSPRYTSPIDLPLGGTLRAICFDGASTSFESSRLFSGVAPIGWQVYGAVSEEAPGEAAALAFDDDPDTHWHTAYSSGTSPHPHSLAIDMGKSRWIRGFTYLPRAIGLNGVSLTYRFEVSEDGSNWNEVATGEFGNIRNSPVLQEVPFASPVSARYLRYTALSEVNGEDFASAAEIGVLPGGVDGFLRESGYHFTDPTGDPDGDGRPLLLDYYFGLEPGKLAASDTMLATMSLEGPVLQVVRKQALPDVTAAVQVSHDLSDWAAAAVVNHELSDLGNGMVRDQYQLDPAMPSPAFLRLRVNP